MSDEPKTDAAEELEIGAGGGDDGDEGAMENNASSGLLVGKGKGKRALKVKFKNKSGRGQWTPDAMLEMMEMDENWRNLQDTLNGLEEEE